MGGSLSPWFGERASLFLLPSPSGEVENCDGDVEQNEQDAERDGDAHEAHAQLVVAGVGAAPAAAASPRNTEAVPHLDALQHARRCVH